MKKTLIQISFLLGLISFSCSSTKSLNSENIEIEYFKNQYRPTTVLVVQSFELENKTSRIPAFVTINDIIFKPTITDTTFSNITVFLRPKKYDLEVFYIGKEVLSIKNLKVSSGDSILLKTFLKNSYSVIND